jgi:hypothetical protein
VEGQTTRRPGEQPGESAPLSFLDHSVYSAGKRVHLKVVIVALVARIAEVGFGLSLRDSSPNVSVTR